MTSFITLDTKSVAVSAGRFSPEISNQLNQGGDGPAETSNSNGVWIAPVPINNTDGMKADFSPTAESNFLSLLESLK